MADVFINHVPRDVALADKIEAALEKFRISVLPRHRALDADANFSAFQQAIESVSCVLTLWTHNSLGVDWFHAVAVHALDHHKMLSVLVDGVRRHEMREPFATLAAERLLSTDGVTLEWLCKLVRDFDERKGMYQFGVGFELTPKGSDLAHETAAEGRSHETSQRQEHHALRSATNKIFISYASEDEDVAIALTNYLEDAGYPCWISFRDVDSGEDYRTSILGAIAAARFLVLIHTSHANLSFDVANELLLARKREKRRFVLKLDDSEPGGPLEYELATVQWIDCRAGREAGFERLAKRAKVL